MEEHSNILEKLGKENHFRVPENYFEDFSAKMEKRLDETSVQNTQAKDQPKVTLQSNIWIRIRPILYVAAMIIFLYGITYVVIQPKVKESQMQEMQASTEEMDDLQQYLYDDLDTEDMYEMLSMNN
ncbi:MAG TPA: hypothetical protein PK638_01310 [Candidatus Enterocola sp.]|jgi:cbb3-type cytochrome oxidase subunit 3|nr:hypothetical protein [Candidatus Enterocola sp.]